MAATQQAYDVTTSNGVVQTVTNLSFNYLRKSDVVVTSNGTTLVLDTGYNLTTPLAAAPQITLISPTDGDSIIVKRETAIEESIVSWADATSLNPDDLDIMALQTLYTVQELDNAVDATGVNSLQAQINTNVDDITAADTKADAAVASASAAASQASTAATNASNAVTTADAAETSASSASSAATAAQTTADAADTKANNNEEDITGLNTILTSNVARIGTLEGSTGTLEVLTDTTIPGTITDNYVLTYDLGTDKWVPAEAQGGSGVGGLSVYSVTDCYLSRFEDHGDLDSPWDTFNFSGGFAPITSSHLILKSMLFGHSSSTSYTDDFEWDFGVAANGDPVKIKTLRAGTYKVTVSVEYSDQRTPLSIMQIDVYKNALDSVVTYSFCNAHASDFVAAFNASGGTAEDAADRDDGIFNLAAPRTGGPFRVTERYIDVSVDDTLEFYVNNPAVPAPSDGFSNVVSHATDVDFKIRLSLERVA